MLKGFFREKGRSIGLKRYKCAPVGLLGARTTQEFDKQSIASWFTPTLADPVCVNGCTTSASYSPDSRAFLSAGYSAY